MRYKYVLSTALKKEYECKITYFNININVILKTPVES